MTEMLKSILVVLLLAVAGLQAQQGLCRDPWDGNKMNPCWQVNVHWSMQDIGRLEDQVVKGWTETEQRWPGSGLVSISRLPGWLRLWSIVPVQ
jgi:hypothetical protein